MRKILSFAIVVAVVAYFAACSVEMDYNPNHEKPILKNPYVVSIPQAIDRLNAMFPNSVTATRARVSEVTTLSRKDFGLITRANTTEDAPLIYIIPTDNEGCAIMGADSRMTPLYAVLESTTLTAEDFLSMNTRTDSGDSQEEDSEIREFVAGLLYDAATDDYLELPSIPWDSTKYPNPDISLFYYIDSLTENHQAYLATKWCQKEAPYNSNLPDHLDSVAGCTTIAVAQIVYHNRLPQAIGMTTFNWDKISTFEYGNTSLPKYPNDVANFIRKIAIELNVEPNDHGVGANFQDVYDFFIEHYRPLNYIVEESNYNEDAIIYMINKTHPVYIDGINSSNGNGHAWVLDGYRKYEIYRHNTLNGERTNTDSCKYYFHSNFGVKGQYDGYYLSKIFDLRQMRNPEFVIDSIGDIAQQIGAYYDSEFDIIFYDKIN